MNTSSQAPRWSVIGIITLLALAAMLTGWLVKQQLSRAGPPPGSGSEAAVTSEAAERAAAPAALSREPLPRVRAAALEPTAGGLAGGGGVQRLEHPEESPGWVVKYGQEFWRRGQRAVEEIDEAEGSQAPAGLNLNLAEVMDRVSHAWMADGTGAEPQVRSQSYTASLEEQGVMFSPHRPAAAGEEVASGENGARRMEGGRGRDMAARQGHKMRSAATATVQPDPETRVHFRTEWVAQGGQALFAGGQGDRSWVVLGNTAQSLLNEGAGVVEHYEARGEGVEVSWVLPRPVAGSGPLVVEAAVEGLSYAGQTEQGHHFADADGVARVRVGKVAVADAAGQRWEVAVKVQGNRLRVEVPEEVLGRAAYPLAIDPALEAEFGMDKPVAVPALEWQGEPAVAGGMSGYLVVWQDNRNSATTAYDIYGARVTSAGVVSDPNGIAICTAANNQDYPAVAASGSGYLVVWQDYRSGSIYDIYMARVTSAGVVSDPNGIAICTAPAYREYPAVAASGSGYLVVWGDYRSGSSYDIYGARVTSVGVVSDPNGIAICTAVNSQRSPAVAASGSGYLVVWQDSRSGSSWDIYGGRVTSGGVVSDLSGFPICRAANDQYYAAVAATASGYLVVWQDYRSGSSYDIYGARVTSAGVVSDPDGIAICTAANDQDYPAVAASGTNYLVVWEDSRSGSSYDIYGARVTSAGVVSDPNGIAICRAAYSQYPAVAASGSGYLVVWLDSRNSATTGYDIYGARVTSGGAVSPAKGLAVSTGPNRQYSPAVASNGTNYLVVWEDDRNASTTDTDIYGVRVTSAGAVSDPNGIAICTAADGQYNAAVAASGTNYLVVWADDRNGGIADIYGARVTSAGAVSDPNGIRICTAANGQYGPALAASGSGYLVVWEDYRSGSTYDIYGARVTSAGVVSDLSGIAICIAANNQQCPDVAANGSGYLVVWYDYRSGSSSDIYGARVTSAGAVSDPNGIRICAAANGQYDPAVAASGSGYLVVWEDYRSGSSWDIYGALVTSGGGLPDPNGFPICRAAGHQTQPVLASDGTNCVVVWEDDSSGLWRRRVSPAGDLLETAPLAVNGSLLRYYAALAYGGGGKFLLVSEGTRQGTDRTVGTLITAGRPPAGPVLAFQSAAFQVSETGRLATITVALTGTNPGLVSADYWTADGTAVSGSDYTSVSGTLQFASGQAKQTFTVPIIDNTVVNSDKTVNLVLSTPTGGATLGQFNRAVLTIKNNDAGGQLRFGSAAYSVKKSAGSVTLTVTRAGGLASGVSVAYTTGGGTAVAGTHYTTTASTLSFAVGETSKTFTVPILNYALVEGPKTFYVTLYNPAGGSTLSSPGVATVTIND